MNSYVRRLNDIKKLPVHDLKMVGDQWRTSDPLFFGIESLLPMEGTKKPVFTLDLFTDGQNSKVPEFYYTAQDNALKQDWADDLDFLQPKGGLGYAFGNPPYSITQSDEGDVITGMGPIIEKCIEQREKGARIALLIKAATSETWWPDDVPDQTIFLKGRVAFERPVWLKLKDKTAKHSAFFGCAVLIFNKALELRRDRPLYIPKKELINLGKPKAQRLAKQRAEFIENFDL